MWEWPASMWRGTAMPQSAWFLPLWMPDGLSVWFIQKDVHRYGFKTTLSICFYFKYKPAVFDGSLTWDCHKSRVAVQKKNNSVLYHKHLYNNSTYTFLTGLPCWTDNSPSIAIRKATIQHRVYSILQILLIYYSMLLLYTFTFMALWLGTAVCKYIL